MDGTDCPINEPTPFSTAWYSHKINSAALRYELTVSTRKAHIVSVNGPWPAGSYSDLKIFRNGVRKKLRDDEFVIADNGYTDPRCIKPPGDQHPRHELHRRIRSRHEVLNKRIKQFRILTQRFRHEIPFHGTCFHAISSITAIDSYESPLFPID